MVDDVSLILRKGKTLGLVGESGSGKSTLGRMMLRLIDPSAGSILFDGTDIVALGRPALRMLRPRMQIVFQDPDSSLDPRMTLGESVAEPLRIWSTCRNHDLDDRVAELFGLVGLQPELQSRRPHELSGGQKQRAALARAIALNPEFLVLDEPTSALDLSVQAQVLSLIQVLQKRMGLTILFISHDLMVIERMSDDIAVLHQGRIVESGRTQEVIAHPSHPYTGCLIRATRKSEAWFGKER